MKIGIIGASRNLGNKLVTQALDCGYEVEAFVFHGKCKDTRAIEKQKNLFEMTSTRF